MKSEHDAFLSSGLSLCGKDGRYGLSKVAEVKPEAGPLPWQDMNHSGEAPSALIEQQLWGEMSAPIYATKACRPLNGAAPLPDVRALLRPPLIPLRLPFCHSDCDMLKGSRALPGLIKTGFDRSPRSAASASQLSRWQLARALGKRCFVPAAGFAAMTAGWQMHSVIEAGGRMRGRVGKRSSIFSDRLFRRSIR